jgi:hypothetical protein
MRNGSASERPTDDVERSVTDPAHVKYGVFSHIVAWVAFQALPRSLIPLTGAVGGGLIGGGIRLADASTVCVVGLGGVGLGGLLGLMMWMTGIAPKLKSALFVSISFALLWGYGALVVLAILQEALESVTGNQQGSPGIAVLGAVIGFTAGISTQLWCNRRNDGKANQYAAHD